MGDDSELWRPQLRRVGIVLMIVGAIDIAMMIYAISHSMSYASSFNVFALIAGIFLIRNSLRAARIVRTFAGFMAVGCSALPVVFITLMPKDLIGTYLRITPIWETVLWGVFYMALMALLWWVYSTLTSRPVSAAIATLPSRRRSILNHPLAGLWTGVVLVVLGVVVALITAHSEMAQEAVKRARAQAGDQYRYFVSGYSWSQTGKSPAEVRATVIAYTDDRIETLSIEWQE